MTHYENKPSPALRFGDVVNGFVIVTPQQKTLITSDGPQLFGIDVRHLGLSVVLSPCCSISEKTISVAPLIPIRPTFFQNEFLADDLTRINRVMAPEKSIPAAKWNNLPEEQRASRMQEGVGYAFKELFIYAEHPLLRRHTVNRKEGNIVTSAWMIDFRDAQKVVCDKIVNPKQSPIESKILELSVSARSELREKIAAYYSRIPVEDQVPAN